MECSIAWLCRLAFSKLPRAFPALMRTLCLARASLRDLSSPHYPISTLAVQEDDRPTSRNFRGLQVIRSAQVAHEAKGKAKIAAMQEFYSTCFLKILTPLQVRDVG